MNMNNRWGAALAAMVFVVCFARPSSAFCGFYVSGADAKLFNNATLVVMMRDGNRTVLSMQNNYQGPPQDFAMVVPVPVVLQRENVKTLPREIFDRVDTLTAPRLVEYWEQDPCQPPMPPEEPAMAMGAVADTASAAPSHGVTVQARFSVGEYDVVVLSATYSAGLDQWLHDNHYKIPDGAEPYLRPYVANGSKFFVARVDTRKVSFQNGQAMLSPLRFFYDTDTFTLPIRLGLINSSGTQDLIVNILAKGQRYEVANYPNVTIPTNFDVAENAKTQFGAFYAALFDRTVETHPHAVVTEYSWDASSCDPCPVPALEGDELATLGADVIPGGTDASYVLTRLHARYTRDALGNDLVFRPAPAIVGGREIPDDTGKLEHGSKPSGDVNNFQGRYAVRHPWTGPVACPSPRRGIWGGPPGQGDDNGTPIAASKIAFAPRGAVELPAMVKQDVPEIGVVAGQALPAPPTPTATAPGVTATPVPTPVAPRSGGCAGCLVGRGPAAAGAGLGGIALGVLALSRRRRRPRS
jgi:hypothetical protein